MATLRARVFRYGGTTPKAKREQYALAEFCKRMRHSHGAKFAVAKKSIRRQLVAIVGGATVDGVLTTATGPVAVELLGYSPIGDRGDVMDRDESLRKRIGRGVGAKLATRGMWLSVSYKDRPRGKSPGQVQTVPQERDFRTIVEEMRSIIDRIPPVGIDESLKVRFVKPDFARRYSMRSRYFLLDQTEFPMCAAHFDALRLQGVRRGLQLPQVDSQLKVGGIGLDEAWLKEQLIRKATLSMGLSRQRANGLPLWLIVHSDGFAIHQKIPEQHRYRAIEVCRLSLAEATHGFARVYWADDTGFLNAAWVGRVL